ncbi:TRAP transporter small permease [uncultured Castellaniella sp.]|uniref:TRAP transporter small permease n=1 Tax=uncultured Castellaniella sp. TaxID=647907 RepID=UPI00261F5718|nr:TRAP transporter small permease [uncultured Castellaniella sp.]
MPAPDRKPLIRRAAEAFMAVTLALMVLAVFSNVVLRYAFGTGLVVYEELSRLLFVWLVCMGTVVTAYDKRHLSFDLIVDRVGPRTRAGLDALASVIGAIVLGMVVKGAWDQVIAGLHSHSPVIGYPLSIAAAATLFMAAAMEVLLFKQAVLDRLRG